MLSCVATASMQLVGNAFGLDVHDAKPGVGKLVGQAGHKPCKRARRLEIVAPSAGVLRDKHYLTCTFPHAFGDIGANLVEGKAVIAPANVRDGAIGAETVAAVGDLHVGASARDMEVGDGGGTGCLPLEVGARDPQHAVDDGHYVVFFRARHESARLGEFAGKVVAVARRHAARNDQVGIARGYGVEVCHLEDRVDALFGCRLDKRAGIHHHNVGFFGLVANEIARAGQTLSHVGRVYLVFRATHGHEGNALWFVGVLRHRKRLPETSDSWCIEAAGRSPGP